MSSPPAQNNPPGRVDELDGLRGLLALWVAFSHIFAWCGYWETTLPRPFGGVWPVFIEAKAAVDTFIILSGFAISFLLHAKREAWGSFMAGRVFRIYPVYLACLALGIASTFLTPAILETAAWRGTIYFEWIRQLIANESAAFAAHTFWHLTLVNGVLFKSFLPGATGTLLTPAWSITLEWQYYLVAPLIARLVKHLWGLLALAGVTCAFLFYHQRHDQIWQNPQLAFLPLHLPLFLVGIASYHLYAAWGAGRKSATVFLATSAVLIASGFIPMGQPGAQLTAGNAVRHALAVPHQHAIGLTIWTAAFGCILLNGSNLPGSRAAARLRAVFLHHRLQHLGKISFPLYLVHWPVIIGLLALLLRLVPDISQTTALIVMLVVGLPLNLAAAELLHRFVEKPGMALGKKTARRKPATPMPEAAEG